MFFSFGPFDFAQGNACFNRWLECVRSTEIGRAVIFDILVLMSVHDWKFVRLRESDGVMKIRNGFQDDLSQRKLNCALYVRASKQFGVACS